MSARVAIASGPAEGLSAAAAPGRFHWLEVTVVRRAAPTVDAALYELRDGAYHYAGGRQSVCECGAIFTRAEGGAERQPCPLCSAAGAARTHPHG